MGRAPCCDKVGLKKGPWTPEEDEKLASHIRQHGHGSWRALPKKAGLLRCGKSCRLRWTNYLRPDIKRGELTPLEEQTIIQLHALLGNRWSAIAAHLPRRTDNEIKNHWNTHLKKRLVNMGLDPATHKPKTETILSQYDSRLSESPNSSLGSSALTHMAQWESARLEAEARLAREAALRARGLWRVHASPQQQPRPLTNTDQPSPNQYLIDIIAVKQQDLGQLILPSSAGTADCHKQRVESRVSLSSADLVNSLHNWENSLQGQVGLAWPEAWRLSAGGAVESTEGQQDSCSCSSAQEAMSPTSTLCSFELPTTHHRPISSTTKPERLSWSDVLQQAQSHAQKSGQSCSNDTVRSLPSDNASDNNCVDEELSKSLMWSINSPHQSAHCQYATSRDKERGLTTSVTAKSDQQPSPWHIFTAKSSPSFGRIFGANEDDLDHYWDNLLA